MSSRVVVVASQKGGSGKTSCVLNLGALAATDNTTVLLDCDPQGSLRFWYDRRDREHPEVRTSSLSTLKQDLVGAQQYDYIFVDTPPHAFAGIASAMEPADLVLVPVRATSLDLHAAEATLTLAAALARRTLVVLTQCQPPRLFNEAPGVREARATIGGLGCRIATQAIVHRLAVEECVAVGKSVGEYEPNGPADQEFRQLWRQLKQELEFAKAGINRPPGRRQSQRR